MPPDISRPGLTKQGSRRLLEAGFGALGSLFDMNETMMDMGNRTATRGQRDACRNRAPKADEPSLYPSLQMVQAIPQIDADKIFARPHRPHQPHQHIVRAMDDLSLSESERTMNRPPSIRQLAAQNSRRSLMTSSPFRSSSNRSISSGDHFSASSEQAKLATKQEKSWVSGDSERSGPRESAKWRSSKEYAPLDNGSRTDYYYDSKVAPRSPSSCSKDYSTYGSSMEDFNAKMKARALPMPQPASTSPTTSSQLQIEVTPGVFMNVLGSAETSVAIQSNYLAKTCCICCNLTLFCIRDAGYVLCPDCRVVSPVEVGDDSMSKFSAGVGLGITTNDLARWQSELNCAQRQSYPQTRFGY